MSLAPIAVVFWLDLASGELSADILGPQLEALGRLASELDVRIAGAGLGGIEGAVALQQPQRAVLDGITLEDLERMALQVAAMEQAITEIRRRLEELRDLKILVESTEPIE
jgi:NADH dehydrogenase FAD-containing subunit